MQELRHDGTERLSLVTSTEQIEKALADPKNKAVMLHKPGSVITMRDGKQYKVLPSGAWKRL